METTSLNVAGPRALTGATVRPGDVIHALAWLADVAGTEFCPERCGEALGEAPLPLDDAAGHKALDRGFAACGLAIHRVEQRVRDAGRERPWLWFAPAPGGRDAMVVYVHDHRWGRHSVRTVHRGEITDHRLTTRALARLLGAASGQAVVRGIAPMPALPFQPVVDADVVAAVTRGDDDPHGMSPWRRARQLLALDRHDGWLIFVYGVAIGILTLVTPIAVQSLVNTVSFGAVLQPLVVLTVLVAIGLGFSGVMRVLQAYVVETMQERLFVRAVSDFSRRLASVGVSAYDRHHVPELTHRFFELTTIQKGIAALYVDGIDLLLRIVVGMPLLAFYHPLLLGFAIVLVLMIVLVIWLPGRGAAATAVKESYAKHDAANWLEHIARMPEAFKAAAGRRWALERADRIARRYRDARRRHFRHLVQHMMGALGIKIIGATVLLGIGGSLVIEHQLTLGQLVAAELVFGSIVAAVLKVHKQLEAAYDTIAAADKLSMLLDIPLERTGGEVMRHEGPAAVDLRGVVLGYPGRDPVLTGVDLLVTPGQRVVIEGEGGSGKSTLLDVLATLRTPDRGLYELDGTDVRLCDLPHLRKEVVLVREPQMVRGTLLTNLRLLRRDADVREVDEVLEALGLADVAGSLPEGLATELLPSGSPLSRTQARRVALARALIAQPRLLVLDGALDDLGLAPAAKERALSYVFRPDAPWTVITTSTDFDVVARCVRRLRLVGGRLEVV